MEDEEKEIVRKQIDYKGHTGFCLDDYLIDRCSDCPSEDECLKLFIKEHQP